jgi:hypothetical protein
VLVKSIKRLPSSDRLLSFSAVSGAKTAVVLDRPRFDSGDALAEKINFFRRCKCTLSVYPVLKREA